MESDLNSQLVEGGKSTTVTLSHLRLVCHWGALLEQPVVQCLAQGHLSSCCCRPETSFSFFFPCLYFYFIFSNLSIGIVTCDHMVTNSEPLGYNCPHDARLVLFGTMLHRYWNDFTYKQIQLCFVLGFCFFFSNICRKETVLLETWLYSLDSCQFIKTCERVKTVTCSCWASKPDKWTSASISIWHLNLQTT